MGWIFPCLARISTTWCSYSSEPRNSFSEPIANTGCRVSIPNPDDLQKGRDGIYALIEGILSERFTPSTFKQAQALLTPEHLAELMKIGLRNRPDYGLTPEKRTVEK